MARRDPHSYNDDLQPETESIDLEIYVDFKTRKVSVAAKLTFKEPATGGIIDLDTRDLAIDGVRADSGPLEFTLHAAEPFLGSRLTIELPPDTRTIVVMSHTSPEASALQWLTPEQTKGGEKPYLFSQCQACHARSIFALQDTPRIRVTYTARVHVTDDLQVVMAAAHRGTDKSGAASISKWEMPQPIPPYLFAFAIGDLVSRDLSPRCRVWAEPAQVEAAAWEFEDVEKMITAAEALFGPYDWERFDILTMPPSFPYGGMENPRLTFLTPTLIAGDRSLVSVVAHELAHSWTGNLVTNANAEHFWLNEGFTMYAERRIVEALDGADMASLHAALGRRELDESIERFADRPAMTKLRTDMKGIDPDDGYSLVPYEKGYFFLCAIEAAVGRPAFEGWLRTYLTDFRFGAITTEDFERHIEQHLPGALAKADARTWIDGEGIPATAAAPRSDRLEAIEKLGDGAPDAEIAAKWTATEWQLYLERQTRPAAHEHLSALDEAFHLTKSTNYDVLVSWLALALQSGFEAVLPRVDEVLAAQGRMKYLRPLYTAMAKSPALRDHAAEQFAKLRPGYHPIAQQMVESVLTPRA